MRAPVDHIEAPPFPLGLAWVNSRPLHMRRLRGDPVLIEFWDFCRPNSIRTLPYISAWHERYASAGLTVIGVHSSGFPPSGDPAAVRTAVGRLGLRYPVLIDSQLEVWRLYGNLGWPARYLWGEDGMLVSYHYGEGAYDETEREIQRLCGVEGPVVVPLRPEDAPGAALKPQSEDVAGPYSGPYEAGGVWAVLEGHGSATANGRTVAVDGPGSYELISHPRSTRGRLQLSLSEGVRCHAVCFTPGVA
jgi:AhpC/TSA family protein